MNSHKWLDAMGETDEKYLDEVQKVRATLDGKKQKKKRMVSSWIKWGSMAASVALILLVGGAVIRMNFFPSSDIAGGSLNDGKHQMNGSPELENAEEWMQDIAQDNAQDSNSASGSTSDSDSDVFIPEDSIMHVEMDEQMSPDSSVSMEYGMEPEQKMKLVIAEVYSDGLLCTDESGNQVCVIMEQQSEIITGDEVITFVTNEVSLKELSFAAGDAIVVTFQNRERTMLRDGSTFYRIWALKVQ